MKRTVKEPEVRKNEIVTAALELFLQNGYEKTTVESIITRLGVAKGCFYHHFRSKEEVFGECIDRVTQSLMEDYRRMLTNQAPAKQKLLDYVAYNFELAQRNPSINAAIHSESFQDIHVRVVAESVKQITPVFVDLIEQGRSEGDFQVENAEFTAVALLGAFREIHEAYAGFHGVEPGLLKDWTVDLLERMLGARFRP